MANHFPRIKGVRRGDQIGSRNSIESSAFFPRFRWMKYPVTFVLTLQYGVLVLLPAIIEGDRSSFVFWVPLVAIGVSLYIEWVASRFKRRSSLSRRPTTLTGLAVGLVGVVAIALQTTLGAGTYAAQIGQLRTSALASLLTPFSSWSIVGAALILYSWSHKGCSRRQALAMLGALVLFEVVWSVVAVGRTAPGFQYALTVATGAVIVGLIRLRDVALATLVALVVWPLVFQLRQDTRRSVSGHTPTGQIEEASERLQLDLLLAYAEHIRVPSDELMAPLDILRYGLIPRALDSGRPELAVGSVFSVAVGSTPQSSVSFTTLGSLYSQGGWLWVVTFSALVALVVTVLLYRDSTWAFVVAICTVWQLLWIETNYPQNITGLLQVLVSTAGAYLALRVWGMFFGSREGPQPKQDVGSTTPRSID